MTTEDEMNRFTAEMTGRIFSKLTELHTVVHGAAELELEPDVEAVLADVDGITLQGMLVAAIGLVSRGELLVMKEIVEDAIASGLYDRMMNENDEREG